jgi:hypothetical protein
MLTRPKRNREGMPVMTLMIENEKPKFCGAQSVNDYERVVIISRLSHLQQCQITPGS